MSRRVFLSHSSNDAEAAKALKERMLASTAAREAGLSVWFDKDDMRIGEPWQPQLEAAINASRVFAVYLGSEGVDKWITPEIWLAVTRAVADPDFRIIPILAPGAHSLETLPDFARQFQGVFDIENQPDQFERLMRAVLGSSDAGSLRLEAEPFFGLRAIDETRSHLFFGREKETDALVKRLRCNPLVLVTGDSGSGKSSLVRAGLVPRWRGGAVLESGEAGPDREIWHWVAMRPRGNPRQELGDAVGEAARMLGKSPDNWGTFAGWATRGEHHDVRRALRCNAPPEQTRVLLVVDQFEELLTLTPSEQRGPFIELLLSLSDSADDRFRVVLTMRHDYVNLLHQEDEDDPKNPFQKLRQHLDAADRHARFQLRRMGDVGLHRIVTEPLRLAGVPEADRNALADEVLRDVGERPGDLALVQMALTETWHARKEHNNNLLLSYSQVGRVEGALAKAAEQVRIRMLTEQERALLDPVLLRLVRLGDTSGASRRVASRDEFEDDAWSLVQKLASQDGKRLVLAGAADDANANAEIAHEALVTAWPHFQNLLQNNSDDKRLFDALIPRARRWAEAMDDNARAKRLATGADQDQFEALEQRQAAWLSQVEREFIDASRDAEESRNKHERLMTRSLQAFSVVLLVAFVVAGWLGWRATLAEKDAEQKRWEAEEQKRTALESRARWLLSSMGGIPEVSRRPQHSLLLALEANRAAPHLSTTENKLRAVLSIIEGTPIIGHEKSVNTVAVAPDGRIFASGSSDGTIRLWNLTDAREAPRILRGHMGPVSALAFSQDGRLLASGAGDMTLRVWDLSKPKAEPRVLHGRHIVILSVAFSPDGQTLASGAREGYPHGPAVYGGTDEINVLHLWNLADPQPQPQLVRGHRGPAHAVAFSNDGSTLASASHDGVIRLWDLGFDLSHPIAELPNPNGDANPVNAIAFSPCGHTLAAAYSNSRALVWDLNDLGAEPRVLRIRDDSFNAIAFSPDGRRLAVGTRDSLVLLWELTEDANGARFLRGHDAAVLSLAFTPQGNILISGSADRTIRLWDLANNEPEPQALRGQHEWSEFPIAFSPDGRYLVAGNGGNLIRYWDLTSFEAELQQLTELDGDILAFFFSADGHTLVLEDADGALRIHDLSESAAPPRRLTGREGGWSSFDVALSADSRVLASAGSDRVIRIWDLTDPNAPSRELNGHTKQITALAVSPDGQTLASGSLDETVRLWDLNEQEAKSRILARDMGVISSIAFSPQGDTLASGAGQYSVLDVYDNNTGRIVRLWDLANTQAPPRDLIACEESVTSVVFSPSGRTLATGCSNVALLWDMDDPNAEPQIFSAHEGRVRSVAFSTDGAKLAIAESDHSIRLWDLDLSHIRAKTCERLTRNLSAADWEAYFGNESPVKTCPELPIHPTFFAEGDALALHGQMEQAMKEYRRVMAEFGSQEIDPESRARRGAVEGKLNKALWAAGFGAVDAALEAYGRAMELDPEAIPTAHTEGTLCRMGATQWGRGADVINHCERALALMPHHGKFRDSRALARVQIGDLAGAAEDFRSFVTWAESRVDERLKVRVQKRCRWIDALEQGRNPFDAETLEALRKDER